MPQPRGRAPKYQELSNNHPLPCYTKPSRMGGDCKAAWFMPTDGDHTNPATHFKLNYQNPWALQETRAVLLMTRHTQEVQEHTVIEGKLITQIWGKADTSSPLWSMLSSISDPTHCSRINEESRLQWYILWKYFLCWRRLEPLLYLTTELIISHLRVPWSLSLRLLHSFHPLFCSAPSAFGRVVGLYYTPVHGRML